VQQAKQVSLETLEFKDLQANLVGEECLDHVDLPAQQAPQV